MLRKLVLLTGLALALLVTSAAYAQGPLARYSEPSWQGEYFGNRSLSGSPVLTRDDATIDFEWGHGSPASGVPSDGFSVRWTRTVPFSVGNYRFTATGDDGIRVYVDQRLIINEWRDQPARSYSTELVLA